MSDRQLVERFVREHSQQAFAEMVRRHVDAVYSAARRQVGDPQLAEDVTQAVFIVLMKRAKSIRPDVPLIGWLLKTAYFASRDAMKMERRRRRHELRAAMGKSRSAPAADSQASPELDQALARLGQIDRGIIAMRFMEDKSVTEIAEAIGISHDAAAKRLSRAIGRLRRILVGNGVIPAAAPLEAMIVAAKSAAPAHLASASISAAAAPGISTGSLIAEGAIKMIIWRQTRTAILTVAAVTAAVAIAVGVHTLARAKSLPVSAIALSNVASASGFIGQLPGGLSVEVLGVGDADPTTGKILQWWSADGTPMKMGPYKQMDTSTSEFPPRVRAVQRNFAIRTEPTDRDVTSAWYIRGGTGDFSATAKGYDGKPGHDFNAVVLNLSDNPGGATVHADFASGPWQTQLVNKPGGLSVVITNRLGSFMMSECFETAGKTHVVYTIARESHPSTSITDRLIAKTKSGRTIQFSAGTISGSGNTYMVSAWASVPMNQIQKITLQTRPYNHWIEIRHISLHPGEKTHVQIVTSDDPPAASPLPEHCETSGSGRKTIPGQ